MAHAFSTTSRSIFWRSHPAVKEWHQLVGQSIDLGADGVRITLGIEGGRGDPGGRRIREVHRRHHARVRAQGIDLSGEQAHLVAHPLQDGLPLRRLEGHPVHAEEPRGDESDSHVGLILVCVPSGEPSSQANPNR